MEQKFRKFKLINVSIALVLISFFLLLTFVLFPHIWGNQDGLIFQFFLMIMGVAIVLGLISFILNQNIKPIFRIILVFIILTGVSILIFSKENFNKRKMRTPAAIKSQLSSMRAQAYIYYSQNSNSYSGVCTTGGVNDVKPGLRKLLDAAVSVTAIKSTLNLTIDVAGDYKHVTCHDSSTAWAAEAPLTGTTSGHSPSMFCVDSTDEAKVTKNNLASNDTTCPE